VATIWAGIAKRSKVIFCIVKTITVSMVGFNGVRIFRVLLLAANGAMSKVH
jgi:hypothetical protein